MLTCIYLCRTLLFFAPYADFLSKNEELKNPNGHVKMKILKMEGRYSPIYDSGCCLAREKSEDAVKQMLNDDIMFDSFINRGKSEIRWGNDGIKLNHFELIKNIRVEYQEIVDNIINNVISLYDENKIRDIIFNIDKELPNDLRKEYGLSSYRKELIFKLIKERILRLKNIIL